MYERRQREEQEKGKRREIYTEGERERRAGRRGERETVTRKIPIQMLMFLDFEIC